MFKSIVDILKLAFECSKSIASIIWCLITIVFTLLKALRHYCSALYNRYQHEKEIEMLNQKMELIERKKQLDEKLNIK
ncbi:hypothetical protein ACW0FS_001823 [Vibrio vulnificus]|uniref:hypothetical protein n=1 Tax=Vibrio TaxID=662 RepID=UPI0012632904|nr:MULTISPECIES: hypothetical protein [Vibrio]MCA0769614.1 hypothetical protein [Vibrio vulnificus]MCG9612249.1 hypothetical protein [Vibrio harveyi]MCG9670527.1 hypothetical protein [Vibrio harveyi]QFQ80810.1 hypothetical protein F9277_25930 [Vibrio harveyi]HAS6241270.1 hypothetical protein [Vibrio vulnificus]